MPAERDADPQLRFVRRARRSRHAGGPGTANTASTRRRTRTGPRAIVPARAERVPASNELVQLGEQPRLADAGLTGDEQDAARAGERRPSTNSRPGRALARGRSAAPRRPRAPRDGATGRGQRPTTASDGTESDLPLEIERRRSSHSKMRLDQPERLLADEHGARLAERLQPRRRRSPHRRGRRTRRGYPPPIAPDDHRPGLHARRGRRIPSRPMPRSTSRA